MKKSNICISQHAIPALLQVVRPITWNVENMYYHMHVKSDLMWVPVPDGWEAHIEGGGLFAKVKADMLKEGFHRWKLASDIFRSALGGGHGSCREVRHAKRSVERIRLCSLRANSTGADIDRILQADDFVETICDKLRIGVARTFLWNGPGVDVEYALVGEGVQAKLSCKNLIDNRKKYTQTYRTMSFLKDICIKHRGNGGCDGAIVRLYPPTGG